MRQRAEDGLEQGNLGAEFAAQEAQTGQLSGKMRRGGVKRRQAFPILRLFDHVLRVTPRPFGVAFPVILCAPILQAKGRGRGDLDQVEIVAALEVHGRGGQRFGRLVIHREMPPQGDRRVI